MTTSVALCTYNGEKYIEAQLRSILNQTLSVGEIVICDDRSVDNTIEIVKKISSETNIPIHIYINEKNLGCIKNFEKAISLCCGEIVFLSDQDDIWLSNKVDYITKYFEENPNKNVVFGNAILIDENDKTIMKPHAFDHCKNKDSFFYLWDSIGFSKLSQRQFDMGFVFELWARGNRATGATMAVKKTFAAPAFANRVDEAIYHDSQLCIESMISNTLGYYTTPLTLYRIHSSQQIGCTLKLPIPKGWDDVRYATVDEVYYLASVKDKNKLNRISFISERYKIQHSLLNFSLLRMIDEYKKNYENKWLYLFSFDFYKSLRYSLKKLIKS